MSTETVFVMYIMLNRGGIRMNLIPPNVAQWLEAFYKKLDGIEKQLIELNRKMDIPEEEPTPELRLHKP